MAKIGLKYPVYKGATKQGVIGKAIQADISISVNDSKLYADDAVAESDKSFQSGAITLGIDDLSDEIQTEFLGHVKDETTGEITANTNDGNPYIGIGFYGIKMVNGVRKFRAVWFPKVQFAEPEDTNATKGESVEFNTPTLEGTIMLDNNGDWKKENTFGTEAEAKTYLETKAGITTGV
ncbi:major tail protein [Clostridium sp. BSD9I1]|uniref:major tail protein n=1 Tax=Clostridium sp. BSD9I1 TaxID=2003589 RepID=UPI0016464DFF|nr:major tail protein [Clostridium sp. BSD9I1]